MQVLLSSTDPNSAFSPNYGANTKEKAHWGIMQQEHILTQGRFNN